MPSRGRSISKEWLVGPQIASADVCGSVTTVSTVLLAPSVHAKYECTLDGWSWVSVGGASSSFVVPFDPHDRPYPPYPADFLRPDISQRSAFSLLLM